MEITVKWPTGGKTWVRNPVSKRKVVTGYVPTSVSGGLPFEGTLERDFVQLLDYRGRLTSLRLQPLTLFFRDETGKKRRYTPDALAEFDRGSPCLYEVKPRRKLLKNIEDLRPKFRAASEFCRQKGWRFRIVTDRFIRSTFAANAIFLIGYRERSDPRNLGERLRSEAQRLGKTTPSKLVNYCFSDSFEQLEAIAVLWRLIYEKKIGVDLHMPLTMDSLLWGLKK